MQPATSQAHARQRARRTPVQRVVTAGGLVLVLAGVSVLAWVGWQMWGTNWQSHRKQDDAVAAIRRQWDQGASTAEVDGGVVSSIVRIPRFGKDYQVPILEGTSDDALASGFGHFTSSADAGSQGNFALAAHRVTHGEPLRGMPDLRPGDEVIVETRAATYTYVLDTGGDDLVVPFTETWVVDALPTNPDGGVQPEQVPDQHLITLTTCSEIFHTDDRMVAFGHLVSTTPREG